jgi:hypothetical protein
MMSKQKPRNSKAESIAALEEYFYRTFTGESVSDLTADLNTREIALAMFYAIHRHGFHKGYEAAIEVETEPSSNAKQHAKRRRLSLVQ